MTDAEVLDAYDLDERRFSSIPGMRREEGPRTIRHVPFAGGDGCVIWSALDAATADAAIDAEIERYRAVRRDFEWKVFGHDAPRDLKARLEARGFEAGEVECLCVLDLDDVRPAPPDPPIALIDNPADLEAVGLVRDAVWGADERGHMDQLAAEMEAVGACGSTWPTTAAGPPRSPGCACPTGRASRASGAAPRCRSTAGAGSTGRSSPRGPPRRGGAATGGSPSTRGP